MRPVPQTVGRKILQTVQTISNKSDPKAILRLQRAKIPVTSGSYLERTLIQNGSSNDAQLTDCAIAVEHSKEKRDPQTIWAAMIDNNVCRVFKARNSVSTSGIKFSEQDFGEPAISCAMAFDATTVRDNDGKDEFVTETLPWIFWVDLSGALHGRLWNANQDAVLASSNVTKVSAIRASYSVDDRFDFGLIVFFVQNGNLVYRQLIKNVWYDGVMVSSVVPITGTIADIAAFRTWDYRIGVQAKTNSGNVYELFTQFEGIGTRNQEHIEISGIAVSGVLSFVGARNGYENEHIEVSGITASSGLWRIGAPSIIDAYNEYVDTGAEDFYPGEEDTPILYD